MGGYLFRDRLDGVVKANTVLIHHPQSFLEGFLKATTNSHHLPCRGKVQALSTISLIST